MPWQCLILAGAGLFSVVPTGLGASVSIHVLAMSDFSRGRAILSRSS